MIAKECCGSCEHWKIYGNECPFYHVSMVANEFCITNYSPRNPIQSKHEKMWNELKKDILEYIDSKDKTVLKSVILNMQNIEEKYKDE